MCSCVTTRVLLKYNNIFNINMKRYLTQNIKSLTPPKKKKTHSKEIEEYLKSSPHTISLINSTPQKYLKKYHKLPDNLYLINPNVAQEIVSCIRPHINNETTNIIESNPGFGYVTRELLKTGVRHISLYESSTYFQNQLSELCSSNKDKLSIFNTDFFTLAKLSFQDQQDGGSRIKKMLHNVIPKKWTDDPALTIVGALTKYTFIRYLIYTIIFNFEVMSYGRYELFVFVPAQLHALLAANPNSSFHIYRSSSVLFQAFCDCEILTKISKHNFLPWYKEKTPYNIQNEINDDELCVLKITYKKDLPVSADKLEQFWYFTRHLMISRKSKIIPSLEKWIPGSGVRLIMTNSAENYTVYPDINIYTRIGDLNAKQIIELFKAFSSWPEYQECSFLESMENCLVRRDDSDQVEPIEEQLKDVDDEETPISEENVQNSYVKN